MRLKLNHDHAVYRFAYRLYFSMNGIGIRMSRMEAYKDAFQSIRVSRNVNKYKTRRQLITFSVRRKLVKKQSFELIKKHMFR